MANLLTLGRIALILPFIVAFTTNASWNMNAAFVIFTIAAITDLLDGKIARARNEVSRLGAALDPLADKLLIIAALILLLRNGTIAGVGVYAVLAIVLREVLVSGLRESLSHYGKTLPVTRLAKWKTTIQTIAVGAVLASTANGIAGAELRPLATILLWAATIITVWTGATYSVSTLRSLRQK